MGDKELLNAFFNIYFAREKRKGRERNCDVREKHLSVASGMRTNGDQTQACSPTRNRTGALSLCRLMPNRAMLLRAGSTKY